uniref:Uncharacterized protein n=1 Tax=Moorena producens (strain JHB) TaxID=1454205 RepID=A0A1D9FYL6_MOOP1
MINYQGIISIQPDRISSVDRTLNQLSWLTQVCAEVILGFGAQEYKVGKPARPANLNRYLGFPGCQKFLKLSRAAKLSY